MIKKLITLLVFVSFSIGAVVAQSKFEQYKSNTNFSNITDSNSKSKNSNNNQVDHFGRKAGKTISSAQKKEYVNLNPETAFGPEVITSFDFPETTLVDLTKHMQKITGINLILDNKELKGKISILAPSPITVGDAWKAYLSALNVNGYSLVKSGAFYKIVGTRNIRYTPTTIYTGNYTPETENYAMRIIALKHISSGDLNRSFRPFLSRHGRISEIKQTNTVIVQDTGTNINRIARLIKFIDVPGHEETLQIIPVQNSSAQEISKLLKQILKKSNTSRSKVRTSSSSKNSSAFGEIIAEPRTNSIIAMTNASGARQLKKLINKLDVKLIASSSGQIHVYYLKHSDSETLAKTLSSLVSGAVDKSKSSRFRSKTTTESESLFNAQVKITSDKDNNALVIVASPTDYLTIQGVIDKLDIPKDQVYVEGLIVETQISEDSGYGVSILGKYGTGAAQTAGFLGGSNALIDLFQNKVTNISGLFVGGGVGASRTLETAAGNIQVNNVNALINAFANDSNTNVLATPQILATDNIEAIFEVGEQVPVSKSTISNNITSITTEKEKVALTLKIKPHINKATRFIRLEIDQKIEDFSERSLPTGVPGLGTNLRQTITTVSVRDRDTIAMGGLMRDKETTTISKVPLLGDIPILGWLFKQKAKKLTKVNMLFFLTPKILNTYEDTAAKTVKDVINRRSEHLKTILGDDDPFGSEMKALYNKAEKQDNGPLFDTKKLNKFNNDFESSHTVPGNTAITEPTDEEEMVEQTNEKIEDVEGEDTQVSSLVEEEEIIEDEFINDEKELTEE